MGGYPRFGEAALIIYDLVQGGSCDFSVSSYPHIKQGAWITISYQFVLDTRVCLGLCQVPKIDGQWRLLAS